MNDLAKAKKLLNTNSYKWLITQVLPHWKAVFLITLPKVILVWLTIYTAIVSKQVIDYAIAKDMRKAGFYAIILATSMLTQIFLTAVISYKTAQIKERMSYKMQSGLMERVLNIKWSSINKYHSGDLLTRLTSDISTVVDGWVNLFPNVLSLLIQLVTAFITLHYYDAMLAYLAFTLGPVTIIFSFYFSRKYKALQLKIQEAESRYRSLMQETMQNMLVVKTFGHEDESLKRISLFQQVKFGWVMKRTKLGIYANTALGLGYRVGFLLAFGWGAIRLSTGSATFGTFTAFLQLVGQVQAPFEGLSSSLPQAVATVASADRLMEFESLELEDRKLAIADFSDESVGLAMEQISFAYEKEKPILADVSLQVKPGEIVALVGSSGEGKTTIIRMLLALITPVTGQQHLQTQDGAQIPISASTRSYFSYVPQGNTLFSGTVADNLRMGNPAASDQELREALELSCSWQFVQGLPEGWNTVIGERGLGLSEGQAQRLAIARSLLKESPILLLDEATSALDVKTENAILENIKNLRPLRTCIVITHRPSVSDYCDYVCRLVEGVLCVEGGEAS